VRSQRTRERDLLPARQPDLRPEDGLRTRGDLGEHALVHEPHAFRRRQGALVGGMSAARAAA
jgi:hypothetical protein